MSPHLTTFVFAALVATVASDFTTCWNAFSTGSASGSCSSEEVISALNHVLDVGKNLLASSTQIEDYCATSCQDQVVAGLNAVVAYENSHSEDCNAYIIEDGTDTNYEFMSTSHTLAEYAVLATHACDTDGTNNCLKGFINTMGEIDSGTNMCAAISPLGCCAGTTVNCLYNFIGPVIQAMPNAQDGMCMNMVAMGHTCGLDLTSSCSGNAHTCSSVCDGTKVDECITDGATAAGCTKDDYSSVTFTSLGDTIVDSRNFVNSVCSNTCLSKAKDGIATYVDVTNQCMVTLDGSFQSCEHTYQCGESEECHNGYCVYPCTDNTNCQSTTTCISGYCFKNYTQVAVDLEANPAKEQSYCTYTQSFYDATDSCSASDLEAVQNFYYENIVGASATSLFAISTTELDAVCSNTCFHSFTTGLMGISTSVYSLASRLNHFYNQPTCSVDSDCDSGVCASHGFVKVCVDKCSADTDCPTGSSCTNSTCSVVGNALVDLKTAAYWMEFVCSKSGAQYCKNELAADSTFPTNFTCSGANCCKQAYFQCVAQSCSASYGCMAFNSSTCNTMFNCPIASSCPVQVASAQCFNNITYTTACNQTSMFTTMSSLTTLTAQTQNAYSAFCSDTTKATCLDLLASSDLQDQCGVMFNTGACLTDSNCATGYKCYTYACMKKCPNGNECSGTDQCDTTNQVCKSALSYPKLYSQYKDLFHMTCLKKDTTNYCIPQLFTLVQTAGTCNGYQNTGCCMTSAADCMSFVTADGFPYPSSCELTTPACNNVICHNVLVTPTPTMTPTPTPKFTGNVVTFTLTLNGVTCTDLTTEFTNVLKSTLAAKFNLTVDQVVVTYQGCSKKTGVTAQSSLYVPSSTNVNTVTDAVTNLDTTSFTSSLQTNLNAAGISTTVTVTDVSTPTTTQVSSAAAGIFFSSLVALFGLLAYLF